LKIASCDAGVSGAVCLWDTDTNDLKLFDMPINDDRQLDTPKFFHLLLDFEPDGLITEFTIRPISLVRQTGEIMAVAKLLQCDLKVAAVNSWKVRMLGENTNDKQKSIDRAKELFPDVNFIRPRGRKPSHDWCEAAIMARYYYDLQPKAKSK